MQSVNHPTSLCHYYCIHMWSFDHNSVFTSVCGCHVRCIKHLACAVLIMFIPIWSSLDQSVIRQSINHFQLVLHIVCSQSL